MDASVNTKPSVKKVREWPKIDFLNFFVKARELIAEKFGRGLKAHVPVLSEKAGQSRIDENYNRYNVVEKDGKRKITKFFEKTTVTSRSVKAELDKERANKFPKSQHEI